MIPATDRWLAVARLRFVPDAQLDQKPAARRRREYRRRLRRFLYAGSDAVMLEGVVERKSWLHEALNDLMVLVWHGDSEDAVRTTAMRDLATARAAAGRIRRAPAGRRQRAPGLRLRRDRRRRRRS